MVFVFILSFEPSVDVFEFMLISVVMLSFSFIVLFEFNFSCRVSLNSEHFSAVHFRYGGTNLAMCTCSHIPNLKNIALRSLPGQFNRHSNLNSFDLNNSHDGRLGQ